MTVTKELIDDIAARSAAMVERLGRPFKLKPGRPVVLTPELLPDGTPAIVIITPQDADGGQAARVQGAVPSYVKPGAA